MSDDGNAKGAAGNGAHEPRIGVFICHCGGNIADVVDVQRVASTIGKLPYVVDASTRTFLCSDPGQVRMEKVIQDHKIDRVIVAACSPTLHALTFRRAISRAGLNPFMFEHVNIREQVSWVVEDKEAATLKAIRLISAAVGRIAHLEPLEKRRIPIHPAAMVIGGGVAGLKAALDLAQRGIDVALVEKSDKLGGRMLELDRVFPTNERAKDLIQPLINEVENNSRITVYRNTELVDSSGVVGDFNTKISIRQPGAEAREVEIKSGAILIAVGLDVYEPHDGEYGYKQYPEVIGLLDLQKMMNPDGPTGGKVEVNGKPVKRVAFIHCVGSRQWSGLHKPQADGKINDYCSRYCCSGIMHAAVELKDRFPGIEIYDFHEDIRTYGRGHEEMYTEASEKGVVFLRYDPHKPAQVLTDPQGKAPLIVRVADRLTEGLEVDTPVDLVVLGNGLQARDMSSLIDLYRCSRGADRFLLEVHPKLRPVELAAFGLFLAGSVQGPMDITEATGMAAASASKAAALITQGFLEMDPFIAKVNEDLCTGCQTCLTICPYDAIYRDEEKEIAVVKEAQCTGCGTCAAACPSNAISQFGFTDDQIISEVKMLLGDIQVTTKV
ncbi:CoB--CoM heterodisulfide reductase iron-sulfur subunit A family protein [bacterium]|nr:CoB--CoM heterodisulfide reductase iron-sulfur subunit A family protein [bacterium]